MDGPKGAVPTAWVGGVADGYRLKTDDGELTRADDQLLTQQSVVGLGLAYIQLWVTC